MSHIEFVGPPGAGKSAVHTVLTARDEMYAAGKENATCRLFLETASPEYRWVYRLAPTSAKSILNSGLLRYRYQRDAFDKFARNNPEFIQSLVTGLDKINYEIDEVLSLIREAIEQYQLGMMSVRKNERLCLDESFAQGALSILARISSGEFALEQYVRHSPTPAAVVHLDCPPEVCIDRQRVRGRIAAEPRGKEDLFDAQERASALATRIADAFRQHTTVVTVENLGNITETTEKVKIALDSACSIESTESVAVTS